MAMITDSPPVAVPSVSSEGKYRGKTIDCPNAVWIGLGSCYAGDNLIPTVMPAELSAAISPGDWSAFAWELRKALDSQQIPCHPLCLFNPCLPCTLFIPLCYVYSKRESFRKSMSAVVNKHSSTFKGALGHYYSNVLESGDVAWVQPEFSSQAMLADQDHDWSILPAGHWLVFDKAKLGLPEGHVNLPEAKIVCAPEQSAMV